MLYITFDDSKEATQGNFTNSEHRENHYSIHSHIGRAHVSLDDILGLTGGLLNDQFGLLDKLFSIHMLVTM